MIRTLSVRQPTNHPTYLCVSLTFRKMFAFEIRHLSSLQLRHCHSDNVIPQQKK